MFRFSISTILLATSIVAVSLVVIPLTSDHRRLQRNLRVAESQIKSLKEAADQRNQKLEEEYFGAHGDPILAVNLRSQDSRPWLTHILNCKNFGQHANIQYRDGWSISGIPAVANEERSGRRLGINMRLLRTLDGQDYYRLVYHPACYLDAKLNSEDGRQKTLLFQYQRFPQLLVENDSIVIAIGPDRLSAIEALLKAYPAEEAVLLKEAWIDLPAPWTPFHPAAR